MSTDIEAAIFAGEIRDGMNFNQKVWALTVRIPPGQVTTYRALAEKLGSKGYRAVGNALNRNPYAPRVPCHRVVGANGALTGFFHGLDRKRELLRGEGVPMKGDRVDLPRAFTAL